jgi:hypothetical protein
VWKQKSFTNRYNPANNTVIMSTTTKLPIRWTETFDPYIQQIKVSGHIAQRTVSMYADNRKEVSKCKVEIAKLLGQSLKLTAEEEL